MSLGPQRGCPGMRLPHQAELAFDLNEAQIAVLSHYESYFCVRGEPSNVILRAGQRNGIPACNHGARLYGERALDKGEGEYRSWGLSHELATGKSKPTFSVIRLFRDNPATTSQ